MVDLHWPWDREDETEFARRIQLFYDRGPHDEGVILQVTELVTAGQVDIAEDGRLVAVSDRARFIAEMFDMERNPDCWDDLLN